MRFKEILVGNALKSETLDYLVAESGLSIDKIKNLKIVGNIKDKLMIVLENTATLITRKRPLAIDENAQIISIKIYNIRNKIPNDKKAIQLATQSGLSFDYIKTLKITGSGGRRLTLVVKNTAILITPERPLVDGESPEIVSADILKKRRETSEKKADIISVKKIKKTRNHHNVQILGNLLEAIPANFKRSYDKTKQLFIFQFILKSKRDEYQAQLTALIIIYFPEINYKISNMIHCSGNHHLTVYQPFFVSLCNTIDKLFDTKYAYQLTSLPKDVPSLSTSSSHMDRFFNSNISEMTPVALQQESDFIEELLRPNDTILNTEDYLSTYNELIEEFKSIIKPDSENFQYQPNGTYREEPYSSPAKLFPSVVRHYIEIDSNSSKTVKKSGFPKELFTQTANSKPAKDWLSLELLRDENFETNQKKRVRGKDFDTDLKDMRDKKRSRNSQDIEHETESHQSFKI